MKKLVCILVSLLLILALVLPGCSAKKEQYPTRAIDLVMPCAPGASTDIMGRLLAKYLAKELGQPVNVVNKEGGNSVTGVKSVMDAKPDGYTLLADAGMWSSLQMIVPNLPYKVEDRTFIAKVSAGEVVLVCDANMPWKTLKDVEAAAKADPTKIVWGGLGGQSITDLASLLFFDAAGLDYSKFKKLVYTGGGQVLAAIAGGNVQFGGVGVANVMPFVQSGKVRILALESPNRNKTIPDVPTTKEAGYPSVLLTGWMGISGPPKMDQEIVTKIDSAVKKVIENKEYLDELAKISSWVTYEGPADFRKSVQVEGENAKKLLK